MTEERIDELKKPWHAPFRSLLAQIPWIVFLIWSAHEGVALRSSFATVGMIVSIVLGIGGVVSEVKARDRMWRQVIEQEAPTLHEKLAKKNG